KVWAELEQAPAGAPGKSEKFGDAETGWKNRLIIPAPGSKPVEPEPEPEEASSKSKGKKDKKAKEEAKPMEVKASHEVAGVPADITPEEVAAIAAAAAAFEEKNQPPAEFAVKKSEIPEETAASTAAVQPEKFEEKAVEAVAKEPTQETPAIVAEAPKAEEPSVEAKPAEAATAEKETTPQVAAETTPSIETVPVPAASVEPVVEAVSKPTEEKPVEKSEAVTTAAPAAPAVPRWTAQEVALAPAEVGISLEQEMQKANAVLQAATAMVDLSAMAAEPPKPAAVSAPELSTVETIAVSEPAVVEAKAEEKIPEVVVTTSAPEPERPLEPAAIAAQPESQPEVVTAVAAAVSAGNSTPEAPKSEVVSSPSSINEPVPAAVESKANESELAAAWAQWKQIRETVVGSQLTSQIAEVAAAGLSGTESASEHEQTPEKHSGNPTAIASIVDSVLAELKPKLVEEIAKKLGDEKNKKK
ncbi:MAG TPA: hypothetical protein VLK33_17935, partial [Terriglobales bacterium]|nr:hypothetical protein [Terriglobales bacterium]